MVMGDFNKVRFERDRLGSVFNAQGANEFNSFILNAGLVEIQLEGYSFIWSHPSASKMSKLDQFLVTNGLLSLFPHILAVCLDNLSDHQPILLREVITDYEATPFRLYHYWFNLHWFEQMVSTAWNSIVLDDTNGMVRSRRMSDNLLISRMDLMKQMEDIKTNDVRDQMKKAKIQWAIEGDENSNFFHGIVNKKRVHLSIKGTMVDGERVDDPSRVKDEFRSHFATRFQDPGVRRRRLNFKFPSRLNWDQVTELEKPVTTKEIRKAVWGCGENKSPGPDGSHSNSFVNSGTLLGQIYVQTAFLPNRQILDGPFIINELLSWCRHKKHSFGFEVKWRSWIKGSLTSGMASILVNGSPTSEFQFHCGMNQGDPLAPYLFILVMESLHLSVSRAVEAGIFLGIKVDPSLKISYIFYADDAVFIGERS
nr:RNA-directed DNA polymerase, eukaryota [Tanacetum cinerariifolium]